MVEHDKPLRIDGSVPTGLLRRAYREGGKQAVLAMALGIMTGITEDEVMAVALGAAAIVGNTRDDNIRLEWRGEPHHGMVYNDTCPCAACEHYCNLVDSGQI